MAVSEVKSYTSFFFSMQVFNFSNSLQVCAKCTLTHIFPRMLEECLLIVSLLFILNP